MVFLFLQIRCKFSDGVQFTVSTSVRRETGSARQNNSVKSGTKILPSCEQTRTHCRWFECRKVSCHKYNRWTRVISRHFLLSYQISQALPILSTSRRKKQAYPTLTSPKQCCVTPPSATNESTSVWGGGGGGVSGMVYIVCISKLAILRQCLQWTIFWPILGYAWVVLNRNACQLVVANVSTTCADVIITAIVTDTHPVAVYVFCVFFTNAILSSPFSWPTAWLDRNPISSYP